MALAGARVAVLIPAYNEERQIPLVLAGIPDFVDLIVVVDDASTDSTRNVVRSAQKDDDRIHLVELDENRGVGGALAVGYQWARDHGVDVAVSMDADGQMNPDEMTDLIRPILDGRADYTKGNRLVRQEAWGKIPKIRLFGNAVLSLVTKIASGYWSVADSQSGYSAASRYMLEHLPWDHVYPRYGRPNDVLVHANVIDCRVADIPIDAIYGVGERSSMRIAKVTFSIAFLLFRRFWWRLYRKYVLLDFHPLVFFYVLASITGLVAAGLSVRLITLWIQQGFVPQMTALATAFFAITSLNSTFFAFWMDMQANDRLAVRLHVRPIFVARSSDGLSTVGGRTDESTRTASNGRDEDRDDDGVGEDMENAAH